jgi:hypothetical protein
MRPANQILLIVSDIHAGSVYAPMPDNFTDIEQCQHRPSKLQRWLNQKWADLSLDALAYIGGDRFALLVNGDAIEGDHHGTSEIVTKNTADHIAIAFDLLSPLADVAWKTIIVEGTECHTRFAEHTLAKQLKAMPCIQTGKAAHPIASIDIAGCRVRAQHHITATSRPYLEASGMSIALGVARQEAMSVGDTPPDVIIASHRHRYGAYTGPHGTVVVTPCWQGLTRYGRKVVPSAQLHVGFTILDWRERKKGKPPRVEFFVASTKGEAVSL